MVLRILILRISNCPSPTLIVQPESWQLMHSSWWVFDRLIGFSPSLDFSIVIFASLMSKKVLLKEWSSMHTTPLDWEFFFFKKNWRSASATTWFLKTVVYAPKISGSHVGKYWNSTILIKIISTTLFFPHRPSPPWSWQLAKS